MSNSLHIMSYNCYGFESILVDLYNLCERFFNIFLYETMLLIYELSILTNVHPDFKGMNICSIEDNGNILAGRKYGGVTILIRKHLRPFCDTVLYITIRA